MISATHLEHGCALRGGVGRRRVQHVQHNTRICDLLQGGCESRDQLRRQLLDEADGIRE